MKMKPFFICLIFILLFPIFLFYGLKIDQINREEAFLSIASLKSYSLFKKSVKERQLLTVRITPDTKNQVHEFIDKINSHKLLNDSIVISFDSIYPQSKSKYLSNPLLPLKDATSETILIALPLNHKPENNDSYIKTIKSLNPAKEQLQMAGMPYVNYLLNIYSKDIKEKVFPILFTACFFFILIFTKNLLWATVIFFPALFASSISLSALKIFFGDMNMITSTIPLLSFIINLSLSFHLYYSILQVKKIKEVFKNKLPPILLMIVTTSIGFGSLAISEIEVIYQFGVASSSLIFLTCFLNFLDHDNESRTGDRLVSPILFERVA